MNEDDKRRRIAFSRLASISTVIALSLPVLYTSTRPLTTYPCLYSNFDENIPRYPSHVELDTVHVLYGLSGNASGFLSEFEISMKSVLMNSPIDADMTIHVMAEHDAYLALPDVFNRTGIATWETRNQISFVIYNIQSKVKRWSKMIQRKMGYKTKLLTSVHTIGTFFRLFVQDIVNASDVPHMIYMDTDVLVMSSLEGLWRLRDDKAYFQFGKLECAGLLLLNVGKLNDLWQLIEANRSQLQQWSQKLGQSPNDQLVVRVVNVTHPEMVSLLPPEWDVHLTDLWRGSLFHQRPQGVGYQHFNGGQASKDNTFHSSSFLDPKREWKGWTLASYFIKIPWSWAKFHVESMTNYAPGKPMVIQWKTVV